MEITVDKKTMIFEIETDIKEYEKDFKDTLESYKKKVKEYSDYISRLAKDGSLESIKSPPYPPQSTKEHFDNTLEMFKAHVTNTITMQDHEYREIKGELASTKTSIKMANTSISSLSY